MADKRFIIDNLAFRLCSYYPDRSVNIGHGDPYSQLLVVHHDHQIPERDGTSGALKRFGLLENTYRVPLEIVKGESDKINRIFLKELIEIIRPLMIVTSGEFISQIVQDDNEISVGKKFLVKDLNIATFYAITNPEQYSFARASAKLKKRGKDEWDRLYNIFHKLQEQYQEDRWKV